MKAVICLTTVATVLLGSACSDATVATPIPNGASLTLMTSALQAPDAAREGQYVAWFIDAAGTAHSAGAVTSGSTTVVCPVDNPVSFAITLETTIAVSAPSTRVVLHGGFRNGAADLSVVGALTEGDATLREHPGQFTMFTPSDNGANGYPSHEESGAWLFNMNAAATEQTDFYVRLTQLAPGWTYEGWMVRDVGTANEIWLSYGKFLPDWTGAVNKPDDTGWGPYSGVQDFAASHLEDFPGDDWISNPLNYPFPATLTLPLNLREKNASGAGRWTHVISIEPMSDTGESIGSEHPFVLRFYADPFGDGNPGVPRTVTFHKDRVPSGRVSLK